MRAKEVHAILNRELGPSMRAMGFQRTGSATATWRQAVNADGADQRYVFVSTHVGMMGFDEQTGNWFALELWLGSTPNLSGPVLGNVARYAEFISPDDKQRLLELANQARAVIPGNKPHAVWVSDDLPYYHAAHVTAYAQALRDMLPHIITVFALTRQIAPPPEVTDAL